MSDENMNIKWGCYVLQVELPCTQVGCQSPEGWEFFGQSNPQGIPALLHLGENNDRNIISVSQENLQLSQIKLCLLSQLSAM